MGISLVSNIIIGTLHTMHLHHHHPHLIAILEVSTGAMDNSVSFLRSRTHRAVLPPLLDKIYIYLSTLSSYQPGGSVLLNIVTSLRGLSGTRHIYLPWSRVLHLSAIRIKML